MSVEDKLAELAILAEELKSQEALALEEAKSKEDDKKSEIIPDDDEDKMSDDADDEDDEDEDEDDKKSEDKVKEVKDVKESVDFSDIGNLFKDQNLSEEFKATASELFEASVKMRVKQEVDAQSAQLQENFKQQALTESTELKESLVDKIDGYLDFMVEQWMNKNELAINRGIKTEILESFVAGMKGVFESHYIDVPDEKYDLVEAAQTEVQELESRLDEEVAHSVELVKTLKEINRQIKINEAVVGLAETDAERFRQLAEELSYTEEGFDKKLAIIKESYFSKNTKKEVKPLTEEFMTDTPVENLNENIGDTHPDMARYLTAIERSTNY